MEQNFSNDLGDAIALLSSAEDDLQARYDRYGRELDALVSARKPYLRDLADQFAPDLSSRTLEILSVQLPGFVADVVRQAFATNHKFLGLFAGSDYKRTLQTMKTQIASHLDHVKYGKLADMDRQIGHLLAMQSTLGAKVKEARELIRLLEQARERRVPVSDKLRNQVRHLIDAAKVRGSVKVADHRAATRVVTTYGSNHQDADDFTDLWFYWATDIPTSLRTLLLDAVTSHDSSAFAGADGSFGGAGASGTWDTDPGGNAVDHDHQAAVAAGVAAMGAAAIATDDSLGPFS